MLAMTSFDISIFGVTGIIFILFVVISPLRGINLWSFRNGTSIAGTLLRNTWHLPSDSRLLVGAAEQMDEKTGKWKPMPFAAGGEGRFGTLHLTPVDGELLRAVPITKQ
jgi:hypothetical protein